MTERTITELTVLAMLGHLRRREVSGYDLKKFADESLGLPLGAVEDAALRRAPPACCRRLDRGARRPPGAPARQAALPDHGRAAAPPCASGSSRTRKKPIQIGRRSCSSSSSDAGGARGDATAARRVSGRLCTTSRRLRGDRPHRGYRSTRDSHTRLALHYGIARARAAVTWADAAASELRRAEKARA